MKDLDRHKDAALVPGAKAAGGKPEADQLSLINKWTLDELTEDQVYVRSFYLASNAIDRDSDVFDDALLDDFARTLPGKGLFVRHPQSYDGDSGPGVGLWFDARVETMSLDKAREVMREPKLKWAPGVEQAKVLIGSMYLYRNDKNQPLIDDINAGIARYVSVGFRVADVNPINDGDSENVIAYRLLGPGECYEASLVWLGAQPGAHAYKSNKRNTNTEDEGATMKVEIEQKELDTLKANKAELDELKAKRDAETKSLRKALGKDDNTEVSIDTDVVPLVEAGKTYRDELVDSVIAGERKKGLVGDSDEDTASAKQFYAAMPLTQLKTRRDALAKQPAGKGGEVDGGDPNTTGAPQQTKQVDELDAKNPLENPLMAGVA